MGRGGDLRGRGRRGGEVIGVVGRGGVGRGRATSSVTRIGVKR